MAAGSGAARRWALVAGAVAVLVALPFALRALPATDADVSAADLRAAVLASVDVGFSGYAVSAGGLSLPVSEQLPAVADLFSDRTAMRVWWRGPDDHRVAVLTPGGETGYHRDTTGAWTWEYPASRATRSGAGSIAVPQPPDLVPNALAVRLLSEATADELSRSGARRVAGRDALGLRVVPAAAAAAVARVDVWVDAASGIPLEVQLFADGAARAALDTRYLDVRMTAPDPSLTRFTPPPGTGSGPDRDRDLLELAGRELPPTDFPDELAGLPRRDPGGVPAGVALYGRGVTLLAAVSLRADLTDGLSRALRSSPRAVTDGLGVRLAAGPLGLMLVDPPGPAVHVLTGTVTADALAGAARALPGIGGP